MRTTLLAAAALIAGAPAWAAQPLLSARLSHEIVEQGADGVTHVRRYEERLLRGADQLWVERVLPAWAEGQVHHEDGFGHHDLDMHLAPRWITRGADGAAELALVDPEHRTFFRVDKPGFAQTGFSGRWVAEFSLIDPASLRGMQPVERKAARGVHWYERRDRNEYMRVLWNEALQLPLEIETGAIDGRYRSRTTVRIEAQAPARAPWEGLADYSAREISDLGD